MALIEWQDAFSVGVAGFDADHRLLIDLINQVYEAHESGEGADVVDSVINVLVEYVGSHFQREEQAMARAGLSLLPAHRAEHERLAAKVGEFQDSAQAGNDRTEELVVFLGEWLATHILGADMAYKPWAAELTRALDEDGTQHFADTTADEPIAG